MKRTIAIAALMLPLAGGARGKQPDFTVGVSSHGSQWIDPHVAAAGAQPMFQIIANRAGLTISQVRVLESKELLKQLAAGKTNLAYLSSVDYLEASEEMKLLPLARPRVVGSDTYRLLLLVRRGGGPKRLQDLRGRKIGLQAHALLGRVYLKVLMARNKLPPPQRFFGEIRVRQKHQSAVLEVLLGEADAVLIPDVVLEVMAQLNPQLKRKLVAIHASRRFPQGPIVVPASMPGDKVKRLRRVMTSLHKDPKGRQMLLTFHLNQLIPTKTADYDDLKAFWREYQNTMKQAK
jgi:phosphonate transport system substrate-binding protein